MAVGPTTLSVGRGARPCQSCGERRNRFKARERTADGLPVGESQVVRVLIVDDSRLARMALRKALPPSLSGDVMEAGSGSEALKCLEAAHFDLMFLDLTMPDGNGYELLKTLQDAGRTLPTIVVSADVQTLAVERVMKLGAIALVKKSFKSTELNNVLARAGLL